MQRRRFHPFRIALPPAALFALWFVAGPAVAQRTPPEPAAAQPTLPHPLGPVTTKPGSPIVEQIVGAERQPLVVHRHAARSALLRRRRIAHHIQVPRDLDRPALAGVELLAPLPPPSEPPHLTVPMPAYPLDNIATDFTTPPPPIVCHRTRRDPDAPDPHLYREVPVVCEPDNP